MRFPVKDGDLSCLAKEDLATLLQECRLLRKDELQLVKGSCPPKIPDCFQKTPKKISLTDSGQILAVTVDNNGRALCFL